MMSKVRDTLGVKQDMFLRVSVFAGAGARSGARSEVRAGIIAGDSTELSVGVRANARANARAKVKAKLKVACVGFFLGLGGFCLMSSMIQAELQAQSQPVISQTQLNREISALFPSSTSQRLKKSSLTSTRRLPTSMTMIKCATPLLRRAVRHPELLYPENEFILHRPTDSFDNDYYGRGVEVWSYDSYGGHFRIYYTEDSSSRNGNAVKDADGLQSTIPQYVLRFAQYFDEAWSYVIGTLGYRAPIAGGNKIEIYIMDINGYGATVSDNRGLYIEVDNDYQGVSSNLDRDGTQFGAMKVTAVHEFFHVVQAGYDDWPNDFSDKNLWWEENSAVWIEDELYDEVDDYRHYLGQPYEDRNDNGQWESGEPYFTIYGNKVSDWRERRWFDYPFTALNKTSYDPDYSGYSLFEYGGVIWAKFLSGRFGQRITKTIFERMSVQSSPDALMAMDGLTEATGHGTIPFSDVFTQFKLANLLRSHDAYEEGNKYPVPFHRNSPYPVSIKTSSLDYLSCEYYAFKKPSTGQAIRIHFESQAQAPCAVLAVPATSYQDSPQFGVAQLIPLDDGQQGGSFDFSFEQNPSYTKLVVIPINLSLTGVAYYDLDAQVIDQDALLPAPQGVHYSVDTRGEYPVVRLAWDAVIQDGAIQDGATQDGATQDGDQIQDQIRYQIWRGLKGRYQTLIFPSQQRGVNEQAYLDSNSFEDSDPSLEFRQTYLYQVKFTNSTGNSPSDIIAVEIGEESAPPLPSNHAPLFSPIDDKEICEGELLTFMVSATDPDEDALTYSASGLPPGAVFNPDIGEFSWEPGSDQTGSYKMTFMATDNNGSTPLSDSATVTISVTAHKNLLGDKAGCFIMSCSQKFW